MNIWRPLSPLSEVPEAPGPPDTDTGTDTDLRLDFGSCELLHAPRARRAESRRARSRSKF
jgi:hypothetical protein